MASQEKMGKSLDKHIESKIDVVPREQPHNPSAQLDLSGTSKSIPDALCMLMEQAAVQEMKEANANTQQGEYDGRESGESTTQPSTFNVPRASVAVSGNKKPGRGRSPKQGRGRTSRADAAPISPRLRSSTRSKVMVCASPKQVRGKPPRNDEEAPTTRQTRGRPKKSQGGRGGRAPMPRTRSTRSTRGRRQAGRLPLRLRQGSSSNVARRMNREEESSEEKELSTDSSVALEEKRKASSQQMSKIPTRTPKKSGFKFDPRTLNATKASTVFNICEVCVISDEPLL
jgi:hypothetical protein